MELLESTVLKLQKCRPMCLLIQNPILRYAGVLVLFAFVKVIAFDAVGADNFDRECRRPFHIAGSATMKLC